MPKNGKYDPEFDNDSRRLNYIRANEEMPYVRKREIYEMITVAKAKRGETIVDFGSGKGTLTFRLARKVGPKGKVIAVDNSQKTLDLIEERKPKGKKKVNIETILLEEEKIPIEDNSTDALVSLASFHHVHNKPRAFREFYRILRSGGRLVIGDVCNETNVQRYFDYAVNRFCSTGHRHKFLSEEKAKKLCYDTGFEFKDFSMKQTPWTFSSEKEAAYFLKMIHDATCPPEKCLEEATQYLGLIKQRDRVILPWQLFYLRAKKP